MIRSKSGGGAGANGRRTGSWPAARRGRRSRAMTARDLPLLRVMKLFHGISAGFRNNTVLGAGAAGGANRTNDLATHDDGKAAIDGNRLAQRKDTKAFATGGKSVLKRLGRSLKQCGRSRLVHRNACAAVLGMVHLLEIDECAVRIHDRDGHREIALPRLCNRGGRRLLRDIGRDRHAVLLRLGEERKTERENEDRANKLSLEHTKTLLGFLLGAGGIPHPAGHPWRFSTDGRPDEGFPRISTANV